MAQASKKEKEKLQKKPVHEMTWDEKVTHFDGELPEAPPNYRSGREVIHPDHPLAEAMRAEGAEIPFPEHGGPGNVFRRGPGGEKIRTPFDTRPKASEALAEPETPQIGTTEPDALYDTKQSEEWDPKKTEKENEEELKRRREEAAEQDLVAGAYNRPVAREESKKKK